MVVETGLEATPGTSPVTGAAASRPHAILKVSLVALRVVVGDVGAGDTGTPVTSPRLGPHLPGLDDTRTADVPVGRERGLFAPVADSPPPFRVAPTRLEMADRVGAGMAPATPRRHAPDRETPAMAQGPVVTGVARPPAVIRLLPTVGRVRPPGRVGVSLGRRRAGAPKKVGTAP